MDPIIEKIQCAAKLFDIDPVWMLAIAMVESRVNPDAVNKSSGAAGLFQFLPSTAREFGINPLDAIQACSAATLMVYRNKRALEANGIEATLTSLYLCHQQGFGGYCQIWQAATGLAPLSDRRKANMRSNVGAEIQFKDSYTDQEMARVFILYWTGRLGQAEGEARKALSS